MGDIGANPRRIEVVPARPVLPAPAEPSPAPVAVPAREPEPAPAR